MRPSRWLLAFALAFAPALARAQVETDGSLGPAGPVPGGTLPDGSFATYRIDESLGQRRGGNLFHSFSSFGVPSGTSAGFTADLPTERVLARVTGGATSVISGRLISAIPGADLYLMNPSGVIFSNGSSLDVQGSFFVSSADYLRQVDDERFTVLPVSGETLSAAAPSAWGFLDTDIRQVTIRGCNPCAVSTGGTFSAIGGLVDVRGQVAPGLISAPGGNIQLAATLTPGEVGLDFDEIDARAAAAGSLGEVRLGPNATLDVSDFGGASAQRGRIVIRSSNLAIGNATLVSGSPQSSAPGQAEFDFEARDTIAIAASNAIASSLSGQTGGAIRLSAANVVLSDASLVETRAFGGATAGDVEIDADTASLASGARLGSTSQVDGGDGGTIRIRAATLEVTGGAQVTGTTIGSGDAGDIEIDATESVRLTGSAPLGPSGLFARSGLTPEASATGAAGDIRVSALRVSIEDGAEIAAQSFGAGAGGAIRIEASEGVRIASLTDRTSSINSQAGLADGGDISLETPELLVANGGVVSATTNGSGDAGSILVTAERVVVGGGERGDAGDGGIFAQSLLRDTQEIAGRGGDVTLQVSDELAVVDGGQISVSTLGGGDAGTLRVRGADRVLIRRGSISGFTTGDGRGGIVDVGVDAFEMEGGSVTTEARGDPFRTGTGGEVVIQAGSVSLADGALIGATTANVGSAGNVSIRTGGVLSLRAQSRISTQTSRRENGGSAGDISIRAGRLQLVDGSEISSSTSGSGDAGTVAIDGGRSIRLESGSTITSQTTLVAEPGASPGGNGGSVEIRANGAVTLAHGSSITAASTGDGDAGSVRIVAGRIGVGGGSSITSETQSGGAGGNVSLTARDEIAVSGGEITARSAGLNNAGEVSIDAGEELLIRNGGRITTEAESAFGGNIAIRARKLVHVHDGEITTSVDQGAGNGGNIDIDPKFVVLENGRIVARANAGNGGNITVRADHFLADTDSAVDASSELGIDGQVQITAPETDLSGELAVLTTEYLDPSSQLARACASRSGGQGTFQVVGGAKQSAPDAPLDSSAEAAPQPGCPEAPAP